MKRKLICEIDEDVPTTKMASKVTGGNEWFRLLRTSKISCSLNGETKRAHIKFPNGQELLEEFNPSTECVIRRAWRKSTPLGGPSDWEVELGEPPPPPPLDQDGLRESDDQVCPFLFNSVDIFLECTNQMIVVAFYKTKKYKKKSRMENKKFALSY